MIWFTLFCNYWPFERQGKIDKFMVKIMYRVGYYEPGTQLHPVTPSFFSPSYLNVKLFSILPERPLCFCQSSRGLTVRKCSFVWDARRVFSTLHKTNFPGEAVASCPLIWCPLATFQSAEETRLYSACAFNGSNVPSVVSRTKIAKLWIVALVMAVFEW